MLANRLSWFFGLKGPSMQVDTACSSSLNALHLACQTMRCGEADMVRTLFGFERHILIFSRDLLEAAICFLTQNQCVPCPT